LRQQCCNSLLVNFLIRYTIQKLTEEAIFNYLSGIDQYLVPALSSRVDIRSYSDKLHCKAIHFCALDNDCLIGMAACYFNEPAGKVGYISSFSVSELYRNKSVAANLFKLISDYGLSKGFEKIRLGVYRLNEPAIMLYKKSGFHKEKQDSNNEFVMMTCLLKEV